MMCKVGIDVRRRVVDGRVQISARTVSVHQLTGTVEGEVLFQIGEHFHVLEQHIERTERVVRRMFVLVVADDGHR